MTEKAIWRAILLTAILLISFSSISSHAETVKEGQEPTCTEPGYILKESQESNSVLIETIPPKGHQFSDWAVTADGKSRSHICRVCGYEETVRISSILEEVLPRLDLAGDMQGIGKKQKVVMEADFKSEEQSFHCYGILTLQGHSTFGYPKKNYTIRFYDDPEGENKHKVSFRNWRKEHKYILKADYLDYSQCRNLVAASIWEEMVQTRSNVPERVMTLATKGAVEGVPVAVYLNGEFFGLYTMNLHKDDDLYGMKKGSEEALVICNRQTTEESLFRSEALFLEDYSSDWEIEFCGTEDETWAKNSFNDLIAFTMSSDDQTFHDQIDRYLDIDGAIDYLIFLYATGLENSGAKDLVMLNYGDFWIPSAYDMDEAFGLDAGEFEYRPADAFLPSEDQGEWDSGTGSLLWDRILNCYQERITERYAELRQTILTEKHMITAVENFVSQIPESFYDYDSYLYPDRPIENRNIEQISQYIRERMPLLDTALGGKAA